jgi:hypothetical protein
MKNKLAHSEPKKPASFLNISAKKRPYTFAAVYGNEAARSHNTGGAATPLPHDSIAFHTPKLRTKFLSAK